MKNLENNAFYRMHLQCFWEKDIVYLGLMRAETISGDPVSGGDVPQRKKAGGSTLRAKVCWFNYVRF